MTEGCCTNPLIVSAAERDFFTAALAFLAPKTFTAVLALTAFFAEEACLDVDVLFFTARRIFARLTEDFPADFLMLRNPFGTPPSGSQ